MEAEAEEAEVEAEERARVSRDVTKSQPRNPCKFIKITAQSIASVNFMGDYRPLHALYRQLLPSWR